GFAANGPQAAPPASAERFCITINLGADVPPLIFNKSLALGPEADDSNNAPQELLLTSKREDASTSTGHDAGVVHDDDDDQRLHTPWGLIATNKQGNDGNGGGQHL